MLSATSSTSDSLYHPPLSLVFFFQSFSSPAFLTSHLTQASHLIIGLNRILLPCSRNFTALVGCLSCAILSTCPVHSSLLLASLSVCPRYSCYFLVPSSYYVINDRYLCGPSGVARGGPRGPCPPPNFW